jgi:predicted DNA-binding transcriptional regulator AlpA
MRQKDLIPFKVVVEELGVSRATLWRAARSNIGSFPQPIVIRRLVFWRRCDLDKLEDALMRYQGRCAFERQRAEIKKVAALKKAKAAFDKQSRRKSPVRRGQADLFGRGGT